MLYTWHDLNGVYVSQVAIAIIVVIIIGIRTSQCNWIGLKMLSIQIQRIQFKPKTSMQSREEFNAASIFSFFFFYSLLPYKMWMERHNNWSLRSHYHAPSLLLCLSFTIIIIITLVKRTVLSISCYAVMYCIVRFQCICIRIVDMKENAEPEEKCSAQARIFCVPSLVVIRC